MSKIAILMSTFNGELFLRQQIDSILNQNSSEQIDLWVRDDGSTDSTLSILRDYESKGLLRLIIGERNLKSARSFMELLKRCGDYDAYAFCDQDDYWYKDKVETGFQIIKKYNKPTIYYCNARLVDKELKPLGRNLYRNDPHTDIYTVTCAANVIGCTMIFNNELVKIFREAAFPEIVSMHDSYLARTCVAIGGEIIYDSVPHIDYRQHGNNVIGIKQGTMDKIKQRLGDIFFPATVSIAEQSSEILRLYSPNISEENRAWLERVSQYKRTVFNRISLACCLKTQYITPNMALKLRISILFGNR